MEGEDQEGGDVCTPMTDSRCCTAEANTILFSNYPPIKKLKKRSVGEDVKQEFSDTSLEATHR